MAKQRTDPLRGDRQELVLDAVPRVLGQRGIAEVSVRSVAREAGEG